MWTHTGQQGSCDQGSSTQDLGKCALPTVMLGQCNLCGLPPACPAGPQPKDWTAPSWARDSPPPARLMLGQPAGLGPACPSLRPAQLAVPKAARKAADLACRLRLAVGGPEHGPGAEQVAAAPWQSLLGLPRGLQAARMPPEAVGAAAGEAQLLLVVGEERGPWRDPLPAPGGMEPILQAVWGEALPQLPCGTAGRGALQIPKTLSAGFVNLLGKVGPCHLGV